MRTLLCLLLTCSVLATDAQAQTAKESQAAAVAAIKKLGGTVTFDKKNPGKPLVGVDLSYSKVTDVGLVHLKGLTNLQPQRSGQDSCSIVVQNIEGNRSDCHNIQQNSLGVLTACLW